MTRRTIEFGAAGIYREGEIMENKSDTGDFVPFGEVWKKHMMQWSKPRLIEFLEKQIAEKHRSQALIEATRAAGFLPGLNIPATD